MSHKRNISIMAKTTGMAFLLFTFCSGVNAQFNIPAELRTIIDSSFTHFPRMKEADNSIAIAKEKIELVRLNRLPDVTADAGYSYVKPRIELPINGNKFQFAPVNNFTASLNGNYTLLDFGRQKSALEQTQWDLAYANHNKENIRHQLAYQVANNYYYIIYLKNAIAIQDSIIASLDENKKVVELQYQNGTALEIDLLGIVSSLDAEENRRTELNTLLQKQLILQEYISGIPAGTDNRWMLDIPVAELNLPTQQNLDLQLLNDRYRQSLSDVSMVRLKNRPVLGLRASVGTRNGYIPDINEMRFNYLTGVAFSMPLYNGGKLKQQVKVQEQVALQQSLAIESMKELIQKDLRQAMADWKAAEERLKRTESQVQLAQRAVMLASNKLRLGTGTHLEVTTANTTLQKVLLNRLQLEFQSCTAKLELARLSGIQIWKK
ncbi:MAG: hypothetical protein RL732_664 [Bacteroidota bacterium]